MLLHVESLDVYLSSQKQSVQVLDDISFELQQGETLGLVGESGCGKSITVLSIMQLIPSPPLKQIQGKIHWKGVNLLQNSVKAMRQIRGKEMGMIFQEPMTALNPVLRIGSQIREVIHEHEHLSKGEEEKRILKLLEDVGIPEPRKRMNVYPHQLSGGMRQRVMIAMALACSPQLLIADEPTTALDVTTQAQILQQLKDLRKRYGMGMLFISHDLDVIGYIADQVLVMYAGEIVEQAPVEELFVNPAHPYTQALQRSRPQQNSPELTSIPGNVPSFYHLPPGCRFYDRCQHRMKQCEHHRPALYSIKEQHKVRCFLYQ
ncbi:ABC transporter ATP-binding protein [Deltaproteobacteria bacterium TL4]